MLFYLKLILSEISCILIFIGVSLTYVDIFGKRRPIFVLAAMNPFLITQLNLSKAKVIVCSIE